MSPNFFENKNYWIRELDGINSNMPKNRVSLSNLLKSDKKGFFIKEGFEIIPERELIEFSTNFAPEMFEKIYLPIVLLQKGDHFVTSGDKYSTWVIELLMGHDPDLSKYVISIADYQPKHTYYYSYQVNRIRKKYPTIIQIIFSMS